MKPINVIIIGILVFFCIGLLFAFSGPGKGTPAPQQQRLTGQEKHQVDLETAKRFIKNHRHMPKMKEVKGGFFARDAFEKILAQPNVIGIRYYYAQTDDGAPTIVLVGVDAGGQDMVTGYVAEMAMPCPPLCWDESELAK